MSQIGSTLRAARNAREVELAQAAAETKISVRYLAALESERFDLLPAPAYARGFLRTYASYLGLDPQHLVAALSERLPAEEPALTLPPPRRPLPLPSLGTLFAVLGVAGVVAVAVASQVGRGHRHPAAAVPPTAAPVHRAKRAAPARPKPRAAPRAPRNVNLVLAAARGNCWLLVRLGSESGAVAWEGTLQQGKTLYFKNRRPLWIRIGAPESLAMRLNGRPVRALGSVPVNVLARPRGLAVLSV